MDEILTYEQIVDDPDCNGLCDCCPDIPFVQTPNGPSMCEGRSCEVAYEAYLLKYFEDPCFACAHKAAPMMACTKECEECTHYVNWKLKGCSTDGRNKSV